MIEEQAEKTVTILLLEDSELDAELTLSHLSAAGIEHSTRRVENRQDFLDELASNPPDLILADFSLPEFDGLHALELVKENWPDIPFLFVSGAMGEEVAVDMLKRGATDYILKQRLDRLGPAVKRALSESEQSKKRREAEEEVLRKARELTVLNGDLEQFAYAASHDLQEPLRTISIFSKMLSTRYKNALDAQANEYLDYIESAAQHMSALLEDLLRYAKIPVPEREEEETDLNAVLSQTIFLFKASAAENRAAITYGELPKLRVNASQISLVFQNLIGNALKYRSEEPPRIHVASELRNDQWVISVADNGIGFDQAYSEQIFGLFKRLSRQGAKGTGLGLAICKRVVEVHGGRMWAHSIPGKGSTFFFSLPLDRARSSENSDGARAGRRKRYPRPETDQTCGRDR
jgi:signal transduction histidine kinase